MVRGELISSAVLVLQDPSVASSPIEKRIAFLQSKNLTQEEIDVALSRVGEDPKAAVAASPQMYSASQPPAYRPGPPPSPQAYGYPPYGQWQAPPEPPKRDWRDWFIMATTVGGVGYGLYFVAKRYITPLIAPPTPPQIEQDKENINEQFNRAFALIDQLSTDTASLKSAEEARTERLDSVLREVENVISDLKTSSRRRDDETRRISDDVKTLKDAIPKALEGAREGNENRIKELSTELRSLKTLLGNRLGGGGSTSSPTPGRTIGTPVLPTASKPAGEPTVTNSVASSTSAQAESQSSPSETTSQIPVANTSSQGTSSVPSTALSQLGRSASIPAWQMAAANRSKTASPAASSAPSGVSSTNTDSQSQSTPAN
ncbi:hypothetical protein ASPZODRAFT_57019 [Penicilliopsis zonata CBS 506.65]|uniref:Peroxisomal membrane protein PEX14 n=1 Tax=Penicilliopsis zonata CBS 506.65 TaxID=1073090 RepID=A0A1L9SWA3_9EURO|nr:hypothetical protein ASPZODRAFT_57019 [Penicilliopsis zonata CBS 506.65]OJJ51482.1 hypothetical protein ASPZODRAFT_57019 [Penicilliopsis zonata CBS 506.65]